MGYYSDFSLKIEGSKADTESIISAFLQENQEAEYALNMDGSTRNNTKWYDIDEDMITLSEKHPDHSFVIQVIGQILGDIKRVHYKAGELQYFESGVISYPEFEPSLLNDYHAKADIVDLELYHLGSYYKMTLGTDDNTYKLFDLIKNTYQDISFSFDLKAYRIDITDWDDYESDILEFSKNHPEIVFNITYDIDFQEHEEVYNDNNLSGFWIKYIQNGKIYQANAFWDWVYN